MVHSQAQVNVFERRIKPERFLAVAHGLERFGQGAQVLALSGEDAAAKAAGRARVILAFDGARRGPNPRCFDRHGAELLELAQAFGAAFFVGQESLVGRETLVERPGRMAGVGGGQAISGRFRAGEVEAVKKIDDSGEFALNLGSSGRCGGQQQRGGERDHRQSIAVCLWG